MASLPATLCREVRWVQPPFSPRMLAEPFDEECRIGERADENKNGIRLVTLPSAEPPETSV